MNEPRKAGEISEVVTITNNPVTTHVVRAASYERMTIFFPMGESSGSFDDVGAYEGGPVTLRLGWRQEDRGEFTPLLEAGASVPVDPTFHYAVLDDKVQGHEMIMLLAANPGEHQVVLMLKS